MQYPESIVKSKAECLLRDYGYDKAVLECQSNIDYFQDRIDNTTCNTVITKSRELKQYWNSVLIKIKSKKDEPSNGTSEAS